MEDEGLSIDKAGKGHGRQDSVKKSTISSFEQILADIRNNSSHVRNAGTSSVSSAPVSPTTTIQSLIEREKVRARALDNEKKQAENGLINKNQTLKKLTLILLFILLFVESIALFVLAFFQGFKFYGFDLDDITLRIIIVASLVQISAMLTIAVRHLFPANRNK
ncbi:hypothetical protein D3C86_1721710 [compost metagenome]